MTQSVYKTQANGIQTQPQIQKSKDKTFLLKGILIGAAVGGLAALIDKNTRQNVQQRSVKLKDQTSNVFQYVKDDPKVIMNTLKNTMNTTSKALNELATEVRDVMKKVDEVRENSMETYSSVKDVGHELKDVSGKVKEAGKEFSDMNTGSTNKLDTN
ncbi:YtxH domain-containing protein [Pseudalkalibacillus decolorationis]|uniref:YtxH domain-containing protein n=1 Tax=Pseudalkalibacillus decolorationis TaxID=163879 RepID=UPI002148FB63|nr:YtxH domain-containing protein [Pseudalkalibacillus decolorationis]